MLIDENNPAAKESSETTWRDMLANAKILLAAIDGAILAFTTSGISEYSLNTGQDSQTVKRTDLASLMLRRKDLINQIAILEARFGIGASVARRFVPGF